jgi:hypothetical protein
LHFMIKKCNSMLLNFTQFPINQIYFQEDNLSYTF